MHFRYFIFIATCFYFTFINILIMHFRLCGPIPPYVYYKLYTCILVPEFTYLSGMSQSAFDNRALQNGMGPTKQLELLKNLG